MGSVYLAEQAKPRRTVALKVIRPDRVGEATLKRFEYEAQLLASLRHPGIAAVYEVGSFEQGGHDTPYFAMEYIEGAKTLTAFARDGLLSVRQRLGLFLSVCAAVQHGHQRGVIHRDLKPANILVDESGEPRVIDFGVAQGSEEHRAAVTMETDAGQIVGTLQYMSPEQCGAEGVDIRSDVYALGTVLYELLADRVPYDIREMSLAAAITTVTHAEATPLSAVVPALGGDLTVIVGKAIEKNKGDRYQSVSEFAADIRRHLADEPILARPLGPLGILGKWIRRNRELSVAIGAAAAVLLATSAVFILQIVAAKQLAERNLAASEESVSLVRKMLEFRGPDGESRIRGGMVDVESLLDDAAASIEQNPPELPETEAAFRELLGTGYVSLRSLGKAKDQLERVLAVRGDRRARPEVAEAMHELARAHYWAGEYEQALPLYTRALAMRRDLYPGDHAQTAYSLTHLAATKLRLGEPDEAERLYDGALAMRRRLYGDEHPDIAASLNNLGNLRLATGDLDGAEGFLRESLRMISALAAPDSLEVSHASNNLATALLRRGKHAEASELYRRALAIRVERLKPSDARIWASRGGLALALLDGFSPGGASDDPETLQHRIEEGAPAQRAAALAEIARRMMTAERWEDAAAMLDGAILVSAEGEPSPALAEYLALRAACAVQLGELDAAEANLRRAAAVMTGPDDPAAPVFEIALGDLVGALNAARMYADADRCAELTLR
jgi:tetratricopeptide (TPR) repeat protein